MKGTSLVVSSCDRYSHAWPIFKFSMDKYWKDCPFSIYSTSNYYTTGIGTTIRVGEDTSWSDGFITALRQIPSDVIIFMLEDYWLEQKVDNEDLIRLCKYVEDGKCDHIRLYTSEGSRKIKRESLNYELDILNQNEEYRGSLNAGIWNRKVLFSLLKYNSNIWDSEHIISHGSKGLTFCTVKDMKYIVYDVSKNMIEKGKFTEHAYEYMEREGYNIQKHKIQTVS